MNCESKRSMRGCAAHAISRRVLAAAVLAGVCSVHAADVVWQGPANTPSNYGTGANWVGGNPPAPADNAVINNLGIAVIPSAYSNSVANLRIGDTAGGNGGFNINGGSFGVSGNAYFGVATTGGGSLSISSGTLNLTGNTNTTGELDIGRDGTGTFSMTGGQLTARNFYLGQATNGHGIGTQSGGTINIVRNFVMAELKPADLGAPQTASSYTMTGGTMTVGSEMYVGAHGPSTFSMSNNSSLSVVGTIHVGSSGAVSDPPAGSGTFNMSGGTINITGSNAFFVVGDHGDGTFNMSAGALTTGFYNIGQNLEFGSSTAGKVFQSGGSVTANYAWVIGEQSNSANVYDLSGGTVSVVGLGADSAIPGDLNVASAGGSRGTLQIRNTGGAIVGNNVNVGNAANSSGTLTVAGTGSLAVGNNGTGTSTLIIGVNGTGYLGISGGTVSTDNLTLGQNTAALGNGSQTGGQLTVRNNLSVGEASTGANAYSISGGTLSASGIYVGTTGKGTLNVSGTAAVKATTAFETAQTGSATINVSGGSIVAPNFVNRGLYAQSAGTASLGVITGTGTISATGGTLTTASITQGTVTIGGGTVAVTPNGSNSGLSVIKNLSITSGKLDLNDNDLVIDYTSPATPPNIRQYLASGLLTSSKAVTSPNVGEEGKTGLGYAEASALLGASGGTFDGQTVDGTALLVRYTYIGDTNLDGKVDVTDLGNLASHWQQTSNWLGGDLTYNGFVDVSDLGLLATNWQKGVSNPLPGLSFTEALQQVGLGTAVPEPATASLLAGGMIVLVGRRSRRRS